MLARDPAKMLVPEGSGGVLANSPLSDPNLKVVQGDVTNQDHVDELFKQTDDLCGVVVALGGRTKDVGPTLLTDGTKCILNGMKKQPAAKRIALITSIGVGDSEKKAPFTFKALMYTVMRKSFADKNNQEKLFTAASGPGHNLEYCIVRPGGLGNGPATGVVNVSEGEGGSIHRADLAGFMLRAISEPTFPYLRKTPCVSSVHGTGWKKQPEIKGFDNIKSAE